LWESIEIPKKTGFVYNLFIILIHRKRRGYRERRIMGNPRKLDGRNDNIFHGNDSRDGSAESVDIGVVRK
jgi:hypothetical protein